MKKCKWGFGILGIIMGALMVLCISFWRQKQAEHEKMELLCQSSAENALENFLNYKASKNDSYYMSGVAEFRSFFTSYRFLNDTHVDGEYIWCNTVYGCMTQSPEKVQNNIQGLIDALEYLAEDYDSPKGFNLINVYSNDLVYSDKQ